MRRVVLLTVALSMSLVGCRGAETAPSTTMTVPTATTLATTTEPPGSTSTSPKTTPSVSPETTVESTPRTTMFYAEPIEDDWTPIEITWGVRPACCDQAAVGPVSPGGPIPEDAWPPDGFYDVTTTRPGEPAGMIRMAIRRWVPCDESAVPCPPGTAEDGIIADPASEVTKFVVLDDDMTVVIRPIQESVDGAFPDPAAGITGSGTALYELLAGFCTGSLPSPFPANCGVDHAFIDWIWSPHQSGKSPEEIELEIVSRSIDPAFPLEQFDDGSSDLPCSADRSCPIAYRGPHGAHLVMDIGLVDSLERSPSFAMYGWWTSLEIRDGRPILYIDSGQIAG